MNAARGGDGQTVSCSRGTGEQIGPPSFGDLPINPNEAPLLKVMEGYSGRGVEAMWDGASTDFNIREDFPVEALERALVAFATGRGASIMTITCANADTCEDAKRDPEKYNLLRARMGGGPSSS